MYQERFRTRSKKAPDAFETTKNKCFENFVFYCLKGMDNVFWTNYKLEIHDL
jgi:hypothetical protein